MSMKPQYDWEAVRAKVIQVLQSGKARPSYLSLSEALGIPRTTLEFGLRREFKVTQTDLAAWAGRSSRKDETGDRRYEGLDPQLIIRILRERPQTVSEIADRLDRGRPAIEKAVAQMIEDNYGILRSENLVSLPPYTPPDPLPTLYDEKKQRINFAVLGDPHFGSRHIQASALLRFLRIAHEEHGVTRFFWTGDMTAGYGVYRGQQNDLYAFSADDQVDSLCNTVPVWKGVRRIMIGGNHDYSFMKTSGVNVVRAASQKREDFIYAGFDQAEVPLIVRDDRVIASAVLWHPSGGVPYALSYRGQKFAAEVTRQELTEVVLDEKPSPTVRFVFWGHLHVADWFPYGPLEILGPGCFEGTNGYLKQKGLRPVIRALIIEADITDGGMIAATHVHPISFVEKDEDYHAAYNPWRAREVEAAVEPAFSIRSKPARKKGRR